jgi:DNA-binding LacI/PurR family transcriptional regulator
MNNWVQIGPISGGIVAALAYELAYRPNYNTVRLRAKKVGTKSIITACLYLDVLPFSIH